MDREKVMSWLEGLAEPDWRDFHSDSEVQNIAKSAIKLLKEDCHNCKLECLLQKYDELKEKYDELLKEQERKKGSWDYGTQCSVCKGTIVPPWKRDTRVNFCPWCGADMRGGYDV